MGRYDRIAAWLMQRTEDSIVLSFNEIEKVLEDSLPESARRYPAFWSTGNHVGRVLGRIGWRAMLRALKESVEFHRSTRTAAPAERIVDSGFNRTRGSIELPAVADLVLVGCVKEKLPRRQLAKELYTSPLFRGRRARAEELQCPWFILSAKYGLLSPDQEVDNYDLELKSLTPAERRVWSTRVLTDIEKYCGTVAGKTIEIHAGAEYRDHGLVEGLEAQGGKVVVPLARLSLFEQISWYSRRYREAPKEILRESLSEGSSPQDIHSVVKELTSGFARGSWDLSLRNRTPSSGWDVLPECEAAASIREQGASDSEVRVFLTLVCALDRAREADQLWHGAASLYRRARWVFDPKSVTASRFGSLRDELVSSGVSQRHMPDTAAWRLINEALLDEKSFPSIHEAIHAGKGDATVLKQELHAKTGTGQSCFPFLSGPKVSEMWPRMLVAPGRAVIRNAHSIPVAVDVQVRKVTEYLGITNTDRMSLDAARPIIQQAWNAGAEAAVGPDGIAGTAAAIDPAVWFFGKWGCTFCERAGRRMPISPLCNQCRFSN
jgi:hypothetical protein